MYTFILVIFIGVLLYFIYNLERREPFAVKVKKDSSTSYTLYRPETYKEPIRNDFNIDNMIKLNPENFGWKKYWRENQSASTIPNEAFEISNNISEPLLYDGIQNVECV